ncbi:velvet factor domain-containing protein [Trichoderma austrokoningii]
MATPSSAASGGQRDTFQRIHRITRENRHLWYQLTVLQQPERARACGSGMKANSDRRPVDPPPVVELRIIEGPSVEEGKDITFDYNANFFLYASLEQARPMAHGRVQNGATNNPPILTGVPASGMAYLDRPTEAGYFIFPDLSVRHEGYFRLSFSLFETTKEAKDFDMEPTESDLPPGVDWRMEIKTQPFNVFSAKKFPGLMESTPLSKTVADQGCRVRIRRDVRMRKRDGKGSSSYDRREEEYARRRTVTPAPAEDPHGLRARSASNASEHRAPYMPQEPPRRPSAAESYHAPALHPQQQPPPPPPPSYDAPPPAARPGHHLVFGDGVVPQYGAPAAPPRPYGHPQNAPIPPATPTGPYPTAAASPSPYAKADPQPYNYGARPPAPNPAPIPPMRHAMYDNRPSDPYASAERRPPYAAPYAPSGPPAPYPASNTLPPPLLARRESLNQATLAPLRIASLVSPLPPIEAQTEPLPPPPMLSTGGKRKHDYVFSQNTKPLYNGQRQLDAHFSHGYRGITPEPDQGVYSRADGHIGIVTFNRYQI